MKLILAISGGIDSAVLLDAFAHGRLSELTHEKGEAEKHELTLAYFHHGTPHASDAESFVHALAKKYHLPLEVGHTSEPLASEAAFREARYAYLRDLKMHLAADRIVTAHHADDQAETVLLNLTRGSGLAGLAGMRADTGEIVRPLLAVPKCDIESYAKKYALTWIIDPTNTDTAFARNRIRHDVIPALASVNPRVIETITKTSARLREVDAYVNAIADAWLRTHTTDESFPLDAFTSLPDIIASTIIRRIHTRVIGHTQRIEEIHIDEVLALARSGVGGKEKSCGDVTFHTTRDAAGSRIMTWQPNC